MRVKPIFRWYDIYIGFYFDREKDYLYFFPLPTLGLRFDLIPRWPRCKLCEHPLDADERKSSDALCRECHAKAWINEQLRETFSDDAQLGLVEAGTVQAEYLCIGMTTAYNFGDPIMDRAEYGRVVWKDLNAKDLFGDPVVRVHLKMLSPVYNGAEMAFKVRPGTKLTVYRYKEVPTWRKDIGQEREQQLHAG